MTEESAYKLLGWPTEGCAFVLPMVGDGADYGAYLCPSCGAKGVYRTDLHDHISTCPFCRSEVIEMKEQDDEEDYDGEDEDD